MNSRMIKGIALLFATVAFAACTRSHDLYDENIVTNNLRDEYRTNFEKKYGQIDPNQTWDFAAPFEYGNAAKTRLVPDESREPQATYTTESGILIKQYSLSSVLGETVNNNHKSKIQKLLKGEGNGYTEKHWDTSMNVFTIWACFVTPPTDDKSHNRVMKIGVHSVGQDGTVYNTCILNNGSGYEAVRGYTMNTAHAGAFYTIDVSGMKAKSSEYYWYCVSTPSTTEDPKAENDVLDDDAKLDLFREVNVNGTIYWCFDSNHDKTYTGLICQISPILYGKRYMIEDLGETDDFDFNDIVVDVCETYEGQKAIIRALGGTLDFTLEIGDTKWTKSPTFTETEMKNTQGNISYDEELCVIDVTGWKPNDNNITVYVNGGKNAGVQTIKFPKKGEAPMIIAVDPTRKWMGERVSVPGEWWYLPKAE